MFNNFLPKIVPFIR